MPSETYFICQGYSKEHGPCKMSASTCLKRIAKALISNEVEYWSCNACTCQTGYEIAHWFGQDDLIRPAKKPKRAVSDYKCECGATIQKTCKSCLKCLRAKQGLTDGVTKRKCDIKKGGCGSNPIHHASKTGLCMDCYRIHGRLKGIEAELKAVNP